MQLFNKLQDEYDQLWKHIIRPTRTTYPESALGPETFFLQGIKVKRNSFQLINDRGLVFYGSHYVPLDSESYPCVIYLHGNSSNQTEGAEYLGQLMRNNISLCTFDFAGCGNSEGEYITLGHNEWRDVQEVYQYVRGKNKVTQIGIWGRSMGAVTALKYLNKNSDIKVGIFDSPFTSLKDLITDICKKNSKIPALIVSGALKIISGTIKEKANFNIYDLDPLKDDVPFIDVPGFFIVGKEDQLIPITHTQKIFQLYKCQNKVVKIVKGQHNSVRPQKCIKQAITFLSKHLGKPSQKQKNQQKSKSATKVEEIDFFDEPISNSSQPQAKQQIDFFAEEGQSTSKKQQNFDGIDFNNFDESTLQSGQISEEKESSHGLGALNGIFSNVFSHKQQKQKINDGYEQTREIIRKILNISGVEKKQEKRKKDSKISDKGFISLLETQPQKYIWT